MKTIVHYSGKNIYSAEGLRFIPGINEVSLEAFERAKRNKLFVKRIEEGILKEQVLPAQPAQPSKSEGSEDQSEVKEFYSLSGLNTQQAGEIISKTVNVDLLKSWEEQEERKGVLKLIHERVEDLEMQNSPKKDKDLDDDYDGDE